MLLVIPFDLAWQNPKFTDKILVLESINLFFSNQAWKDKTEISYNHKLFVKELTPDCNNLFNMLCE